MPRAEPLFMKDFLYPSLRSNRFPGLLEWTNEAEKEYEVKWSHKSKGGWEVSEFAHFAEWDILKNNHTPESAEYWTLSKQRFRNTLRKLEILGKVKRLPGRRGYRKYKICSSTEIKDNGEKKKKLFMHPEKTERKSRQPVILKVVKAMQAYKSDVNGNGGFVNAVLENPLFSIVLESCDKEADIEKCMMMQNSSPNTNLESDYDEAFKCKIPFNDSMDVMIPCDDITYFNDPLLSMFPNVYSELNETDNFDDKENRFTTDESINDLS